MPATRPDLLFHRAGDQWIVVDPIDDRSHTLNPAAYWILHHADGRSTPEDLAAGLSDLAGIPLARARADVDAALAHFADLGLVTD